MQRIFIKRRAQSHTHVLSSTQEPLVPVGIFVLAYASKEKKKKSRSAFGSGIYAPSEVFFINCNSFTCNLRHEQASSRGTG